MIGSIRRSVSAEHIQNIQASGSCLLTTQLEDGNKFKGLGNELNEVSRKSEIQIEKTESGVVRTENITEKLNAIKGAPVELKLVAVIKSDTEDLKERASMALNEFNQKLTTQKQECESLEQDRELLSKKLEDQLTRMKN